MKWIPLAIMNLVLVSDIKIFFLRGRIFWGAVHFSL